MTRRQLADALGVHYQTVGYLERGEYNPSLHLALRIAEFFDLPVETIFSTRAFPRISDLPRPADPQAPGPHRRAAPREDAEALRRPIPGAGAPAQMLAPSAGGPSGSGAAKPTPSEAGGVVMPTV